MSYRSKKKSDLKNAAGVITSDFAKNADLLKLTPQFPTGIKK